MDIGDQCVNNFVKTTHLEAVVQRVVANVLVDSNVTTLLDLVTLDVHQGTMEVNVKRHAQVGTTDPMATVYRIHLRKIKKSEEIIKPEI